ncbi:hypothetical protein [Persicitalea jodogahamensis]
MPTLLVLISLLLIPHLSEPEEFQNKNLDNPVLVISNLIGTFACD